MPYQSTRALQRLGALPTLGTGLATHSPPQRRRIHARGDRLEARTGFEPACGGFANRCLTAWLPRQLRYQSELGRTMTPGRNGIKQLVTAVKSCCPMLLPDAYLALGPPLAGLARRRGPGSAGCQNQLNRSRVVPRAETRRVRRSANPPGQSNGKALLSKRGLSAELPLHPAYAPPSTPLGSTCQRGLIRNEAPRSLELGCGEL